MRAMHNTQTRGLGLVKSEDVDRMKEDDAYMTRFNLYKVPPSKWEVNKKVPNY